MNVLIICNGFPPSESLFRKETEKADLFIGADGGGNRARNLGRLPDIVTGDMDSFQRRAEELIEIVEDSDQETNDLEKALSLALDRGANRVTVLGATGQRIDQTLKNLSVLTQFTPRLEHLVFRDDLGDTFLIPENFSIDLSPGTLISLFPLSGKVEGITTEGLKYSLSDDTLEMGVRVGLSNQVVDSAVNIQYRSGNLLIFIGYNV